MLADLVRLNLRGLRISQLVSKASLGIAVVDREVNILTLKFLWRFERRK
jgi:hypothetical protein